nr:hypothetical protein [Eikenella exigua]
MCARNRIHVLERAVTVGSQRISYLPNLLGGLVSYREGQMIYLVL